MGGGLVAKGRRYSHAGRFAGGGGTADARYIWFNHVLNCYFQLLETDKLLTCHQHNAIQFRMH